MVEACMNAGLAQMKAWASEIEHPSYGPLSDAEFQRVMRQSETLKHGLLDIAEPDGDVNAGVSAVLDVIRAEPNGWGY